MDDTSSKRSKRAPIGQRTLASLNPLAMLFCVLASTFVFSVVLAVRSMDIHYNNSFLSLLICVLLLVIVCVVGAPSWDSSTPLGRLRNFTLVSCTLAWVLGMIFGDICFNEYFRPYFDTNNLNVYPNVDPSTYTGTQLMDAGQIEFAAGSHLDLTRSYGFKNEDLYCVAPIVGPKQNNSNMTMANYDFWAVGINCCSGHVPNYHCGEYANPQANKGLRLMRDDLRGYFRLAVEEATATYNIQAAHPVFMYWMLSPSDEVRAYQDDGWKFFQRYIFAFLGLQAFLTVVVVMSCI
jgi:hypothetical protein